jgi:serine phosphatase RsbU (regulator of sigma subunit)/DNA-binding NarL/FixJ family response regulator
MTGTPGSVLLVDDDEAKRYVMANWLKRAGHRVTEVATGSAALDLVSTAELVILDVNLPDISGFDVCRQIKSDPRTAAIPVIQVSATAVEVKDRAHGLTQGADAYLIDPADPEELLATVAAALRYHRARLRAERTARLLSLLTAATLEINAAETFDGLALAAASGAAQIFSTEVVLVVEMPDGQVRRVSAAPDRRPIRRGGPPGLADRVVAHVLVPDSDVLSATVSEQAWLSTVPDSTLRTDVCLAAVRTKPGRPPVAMAVARDGIAGEEEEQILRQLVQATALGVEALRSYAEEHLIALTLQRSFLPSALPVTPGLAMAFRYMPASDQAEVGGDFYEALTVGDRLLVAIGDVQGHSLRAAAVMGELRHALRAFVSEGHPPQAITGLVNEVLLRYHPGLIASLCLLDLDPASGEVQIVNCGHIPPLFVASGSAVYRGEGGLVLGLPEHEPHTETACLPAGGTALLITDGLIEDRNVSIDTNLEKLRAAAEAAWDYDVEAFSNEIISIFGFREDDVAMIVLRRLSRS